MTRLPTLDLQLIGARFITLWHRVTLASVLVPVLAACGNPPPLVGPDPTACVLSQPAVPTTPRRLVTGLQGAQGSAVGPGGALFVTEPATGRVVRVDPKTGAVTTFASGLPTPIFPLGGVMDVAFIGPAAYALVTLVGPDIGGQSVVGVYRMDSSTSFTVIADIGAFSLANPSETDFFVPTGTQYALEPFGDGFLVTDGHHNRVLHVTLDGEVSESMAFGNTVPTGLAVSGSTVYMAEAGPVPHLPETGRVVAFRPGSSTAAEVAAGAGLLVDVEFGCGRTLFALSQGVWDGAEVGSPALPNTGSLVRATGDGTFRVVAAGLDRPTSFEIIGNTAYVVTLGGEVWTVDHIAGRLSGTGADSGKAERDAGAESRQRPAR